MTEMKLLLEEARDILMERRHGNAARSPGHNARLVIEDALKLAASPQAPAREGVVISDGAILKAATSIRESSVAWANEPDEFAHLIELTPGEVRKLIAALTAREEAPDHIVGVNEMVHPESGASKSVEVTIFCPECALPHVDEGEWATTRQHKTHQCQGCGHEWRPFPFATVGVVHPREEAPAEGADVSIDDQKARHGVPKRPRHVTSATQSGYDPEGRRYR